MAASAQGSLYATSQYLSALCEATAGNFRILAAARGNELVGGIALFEQQQGSLTRVAPRPLLYYNGLVLCESTSKYPSLATAKLLEVSSAIEAQISSSCYEKVVLKNHWSFLDARSFWRRAGPFARIFIRCRSRHRGGLAARRTEPVAWSEGVRSKAFASLKTTTSPAFRLHAAGVERQECRLLARGPFLGFIRRPSPRASAVSTTRLPTGQSISAQIVLTGPHPVSHTSARRRIPASQHGATAFRRWKVFEALSILLQRQRPH